MFVKIVYVISDIDKSLSFEWIADHLNKENFLLSFILLNPGESVLENYLKEKGYEVRRIRCRGKKDWLNGIYQLYSVLKTIKPDVVHCHMINANIIGLTAARLAGIKKRIYTRHHSDFHQRYFPKGVLLDKVSNNLATKIVAPSAVVKEVLTKLEKVHPQKIKVIHHGFKLDSFSNVSLDRVNHLRSKYQVNEAHPVIGVISRFTELKGIQYIIPAFARLLQKYPDAILLLFNAKGDYTKEINSQLRLLPENSYRVILFENDLQAVYKLFDIFVQASIDRTIESFGQTYVEALASGVPSVFTMAGIADDFVRDKENALVVPFRDSEAIYNAMLEILNSDKIRTDMIVKGRQSVNDNFSLDKMIQNLEELYVGS